MFVKVCLDTVETTATVMFIVAAASIFGWMLTATGVTAAIAQWVLAFTKEPWVFLLLANLLMLFVGCFLEPTAAITILVPILLPIARQLGVDPVHFGLVMVLNLMIGLLHPPMGMVLFVLARVAKLSVERTTMAILPWLVPLLVQPGGPDLRAGDRAVAAAVDGVVVVVSRSLLAALSSCERARRSRPAGGHFHLLAQMKVTKAKGLNTDLTELAWQEPTSGSLFDSDARWPRMQPYPRKSVLRTEPIVASWFVATSTSQIVLAPLLWLLSFGAANESSSAAGRDRRALTQ